MKHKSIWFRELIPEKWYELVLVFSTICFVSIAYWSWQAAFVEKAWTGETNWLCPAFWTIIAMLHIILIGLGVMCWAADYRMWRTRFNEPGCCRKCGHNLQGSRVKCPECGAWHGVDYTRSGRRQFQANNR